MTGPTHFALGLAGALAYRALTGQTPVGWAWAALLAGSLAPDLDGGGVIARPGAVAGKLIPGWLRKLIDFFTVTLSMRIKSLVGHRGLLHWPLLAGVMLYVGHNAGYPLLFFLGVGWLAHLAGDILTKEGVPLLAPLSTRKISLTPFKTGGFFEGLISVGLWGYVGYTALGIFFPEAQTWLVDQLGGLWKFSYRF
jgi:inner membrane protein